MVRVLVSGLLIKKIRKKFKTKSKQVFRFMKKLEKNPDVGKILTQVGRVKLKELRYDKVFRFYFLINNDLVKIMDRVELDNLLIKFVDMSKKGKEQQEVIDRLKNDLKKLGFEFF